MTVKLIDSIVYGSTAKYSGNVYVHEVSDGISKLVCEITNVCRNFGYYEYLPLVDGEGSRSLSLTTASETLLSQAYSLRQGNYLYKVTDIIISGTGNYTWHIYEYDLTTDTEIHLEFVENNDIYHWALLGERQVVMLTDDDDDDAGPEYHNALKVVDFNTEAITTLKRYVWMKDLGADWEYYRSEQLTVVPNDDGFIIAIAGVYTFYEDSTGDDWEEFGYVLYDTVSDTITQGHEVYVEIIRNATTSMNYYVSPQIVDGKIVYVVGTLHYDDNYVGLFIVVLDYIAGTASITFHENPDPENYEVYCEYAASDLANGDVYLAADEWGDNSALLKFDVSTEELSVIQLGWDGYWFYPIAGNNEIYVYDETNGNIIDTSGNILYELGPDHWISNGLGMQFDDAGRKIWYYTEVGNKLVSVSVDDWSSEEFALTTALDSSSQQYLLMLGDVAIVYCRFTTKVCLIRNA